MKLYKYYLIGSLFLLLSSCASTKPPIKVSGTELTPDNIYEHYCSDSKQIRQISIETEYVRPALHSGLIVDYASTFQKHLTSSKDQTLYSLFYLPTGYRESITADYIFTKHSKKPRKEILETVYAYKIGNWSNVRNSTMVLKPSDSDTFITFHIPQRNDRIDDYQNFNDGDDIIISEMKTLLDNFTLIEPIEFQYESYERFERKCYRCDRTLAIKENDEHSISYAVEYRSIIWKRYIDRFTSVQELPTNDPRTSTIMLSLDLNGFCKYGQKITDLIVK